MSTTDSILVPQGAVVLDDELDTSTRDAEDAAYVKLLQRLSHQSVVKHFDAYADVAWDAPEMRIDPSDPRWELDADDTLGATAWYRAQPQPVRAALGLHLFATFMKIGLQFESVLKRGLLEYAFNLPNGAPEFRYVYHEVIEEAQHSLMFQEFVNRSGFDVRGLRKWEKTASRMVVRLGRTFPELFFLFVLGGEDPIDHVQRQMLKKRDDVQTLLLRKRYDVHPLLRRVSQIHVTEEARHLSFARLYLRRNVPRLGVVKKTMLRVRTPLILGQMSQMMMRPSPQIVRRYAIPETVLREAYDDNPKHRAQTTEAIAKVRKLCQELDLITPTTVKLWKAFHLWPADGTAA
ncbi:diiron oxygenase [Candidatus Binatia bacterium]|nr:diiron oxygenase [Candidatus Binatia bacterium]